MIHSLGVVGKTVEIFNDKGQPTLFCSSEPERKDEILPWGLWFQNYNLDREPS